jgi:hypothetical protein
MNKAIIILSFACGALLIHSFFAAAKTDRQAKEIDALEHKVDSLKFAKYMDSLSGASYNNSKRILESIH